MDDVVGSKTKAVEADVSEVKTDTKVEAETEKPVVVDLSPSVGLAEALIRVPDNHTADALIAGE